MPEASKNVRILLLDDEPSVSFALKLLLQALGYTVTDFNSPPKALEYLGGGNSADLFLCDLKMPIMNGLKVLEETKKLLPDLPFVLMSAHASNDEVKRARELGAFNFLAKPFTPEQIHEVLAELPARIA